MSATGSSPDAPGVERPEAPRREAGPGEAAGGAAMVWVWGLLRAVRPRQWAKNGLVYVPLLFTVHERWDPAEPGQLVAPAATATAAFLLFCLLSSATYLVNDVLDAPMDRAHPLKRHRPVAAGSLSRVVALWAAAAMMVAGVGLALLVGPWFGGVAALYLALTLAYSLALKRVALVDVMALSGGYLLRAVAGAVAIGVPISPWLYVVTGLGAMVIGFGKRRNELALAQEGEAASRQREALMDYSLPLLDQLIAVVAPSTLLAYTLYTFTAENLPRGHLMMLTIPFVAYGLFRYLLLVYRRNLGEQPEEILLADRPLLGAIGLWVAASVAVLVLGRPG